MEERTEFKIIIDPKYIRQLIEDETRRLLQDKGPGMWWDLKRLEAETCRKRDWLLENVLLNPAFKEQMQFITNNCEGGRWMFRGLEMQRFLDEHFHDLNRPR
ncbi:protein of unknown function [Paenibacillus sophorae]|uniref:DUF771 domain-containing protein n=1 Tax=Paenibacillus sophorae TaxID=1333845 RepID=A0A1H8VV75_9BACL|nr:DUF771 domain-containing protein [Paenibacillus sophorae]QWU15710.1 DUF771 domain-containing protein [Paenibacillus sophorae]SEP18818.1 protein of unknown function [Paenibacillus sophorae]